jgi:hypothetical protein
VRKSAKSGRLYLDDMGIKKLNEMMGALSDESSHLDLSPSKLVSKILITFCDKYFQREKKKLSKELFDKKSYIKHLLKSTVSQDELIEQVAKLHEGGPRARKKKLVKAKKEPQATASEES